MNKLKWQVVIYVIKKIITNKNKYKFGSWKVIYKN